MTFFLPLFVAVAIKLDKLWPCAATTNQIKVKMKEAKKQQHEESLPSTQKNTKFLNEQKSPFLLNVRLGVCMLDLNRFASKFS